MLSNCYIAVTVTEAILKHILEDSGTSMLVYNLGYTFLACMTKVMNWATTAPMYICVYVICLYSLMPYYLIFTEYGSLC